MIGHPFVACRIPSDVGAAFEAFWRLGFTADWRIYQGLVSEAASARNWIDDGLCAMALGGA